MPKLSENEFAMIIAEVREITESNIRICALTGHRQLVKRCIKDARRVLNNIAVFIDDSAIRSAADGPTAAAAVSESLAHVALMRNFGKNSTRDAQLRRYPDWQQSAREAMPRTSRPLCEFAQATMRAIEQMQSDSTDVD